MEDPIIPGPKNRKGNQLKVIDLRKIRTPSKYETQQRCSKSTSEDFLKTQLSQQDLLPAHLHKDIQLSFLSKELLLT